MASSDQHPSIVDVRIKRRWYDREPLAIWLPLAAVAGGTVQTVAYVGYKLFYNSFGVRPEEVGYEYTSLIPRTAFQLALIISLALLLLSVLSFSIAFYGVLLKPILDDWRGPKSSTMKDIGGRGWAVAIVSCMCALGVHAATAVSGSNFLGVILGFYVALLLIGHAHARSEGRAESSLLSALLAPRVYRGNRRLILIGAGAALPTLDVSPGPETILMTVLVLYGFDRMIPVVDKREVDAPGGGRSKWLWRATVLGSTGAIAFVFLAALSAVLEASHLDSKVQQVRSGHRLTYSVLNPFVLAEPRADPVRVRWVAGRPPSPFTRKPRVLTYLGQNGGTSVFLDTRIAPEAVYRVPASAVTIEDTAQPMLP